MRVYLDMCSIQRPLDTKSQVRIAVEAEAIPQTRSLNDITQEAIGLLSRELGLVATLRFLGQFTTGFGNYTEERETLFKDLTLDEALAGMKGNRT